MPALYAFNASKAAAASGGSQTITSLNPCSRLFSFQLINTPHDISRLFLEIFIEKMGTNQALEIFTHGLENFTVKSEIALRNYASRMAKSSKICAKITHYQVLQVFFRKASGII
jgi:hypothetical protein